MACFQIDVVGALKPACTFLLSEVTALTRLQKVKQDLVREMNHLKKIKIDVENDVRRQEQNPRMERTAIVSSWMKEVDDLDRGVNEFMESFDDKATKGCFRRWCSCWSKYKLGKVAMDLAEQVRRLTNDTEKIKNNLAHLLPHEVVEEVATSTLSVIGGEETLAQVQSLLNDDAVGIIGVYGMGGIGKTTLLKTLNNEMSTSRSKNFDVVIWVTVSKDLNIIKIQEGIGDRLRISYSSPSNIEVRARDLFAALSEKRFLIFLDDVWAKLDMEVVGIPLPDPLKGRKIVLSARSEEVCIDMDATRVKVPGLDEKRSWDLFCQKVGVDVDVNSPIIRPLAEEVVAQCGGLPLTLITIGRAMANKKDPDEWRHTVNMLKRSPGEVRGMEEHVLSVLKFSFDALESETLRSCLLYCSLFPEDQDIPVSELVDYWIGESFVGGDEYDTDLFDLRGKARDLIRRLQAACLLESDADPRYVRMHDSIRDMALWLTSPEAEGGEDGGGSLCINVGVHRRRREVFLVHVDKEEDAVFPMLMGEATRVSLRVIPDELPRCNNMSTLFALGAYGNGVWRRIPEALFQLVPNLRVLELSGSGISELPSSIRLLVHLRYLGLSNTHIRSLPKEVGDLLRLRQLDLSYTRRLVDIPREAIVRLSNLLVLNMRSSAYKWFNLRRRTAETTADCGGRGAQLEVTDLQCLKRLSELEVSRFTQATLANLASSRALSRCLAFLSVFKGPDDALTATELSVFLHKFGQESLQCLDLCDDETSPMAGELRLRGDWFPKLQELVVFGLYRARFVVEGSHGSLFQSLSCLRMDRVHGIRDLNWAGKLPSLAFLAIDGCKGLEEILTTDDGQQDDDGYFPKLRELVLSNLPALKFVRRRPLLFPSLVRIAVFDCPGLRRLPLGTNSAERLRWIDGWQEWWDGLEWDDDRIKAAFAAYFTHSGTSEF